MALPENLLKDAKNYLDITWEDPEGDDKLSGILQRGIAHLDHLAGASLGYEEGTDERALLYDYARYVRAGALQDFDRDFAGELLGLNLRKAVEIYGADGGDAGTL